MPLPDEFAQPLPIGAPAANKPLEARTVSGKAIMEPDQEVRALLRTIVFELRKGNRLTMLVNNIELADSDVEG